MKFTNYKALFVAGSILISMLSACESHEQKADAFDRYKKAKAEDTDTVVIVKEVRVPAKTVVISECASAWLKYRGEVERKISDNDREIAKLKSRIVKEGKNQKAEKALTRLHEKNADMRKKLDKFNEEVNEKLANFKEDVNKDVAEIGAEIKEVSAKK